MPSASLDLWEIQRNGDASASMTHIVSLSLPPRSSPWEFNDVDCYSSPSPGGLCLSSWDSHDEAILIFHLIFHCEGTSPDQVATNRMVVHGRQLLRAAMENDSKAKVDRPKTVPWEGWGETATHWNFDSEAKLRTLAQMQIPESSRRELS